MTIPIVWSNQKEYLPHNYSTKNRNENDRHSDNTLLNNSELKWFFNKFINSGEEDIFGRNA